MARHDRDRKREQTWRQHLQRQQASGQTARAYCLRHGLAESAFHYWRRTIAVRDREARRAPPVPAFVPVVVAGRSSPADAPIDIRLAGGHRVRVRAGCDRELLAAVLGLLGAQPC
jgi:hypothetical protein